MEQEEYTREEIDWSYIDFIDNQDVLDLLEKVCKIPAAKYCDRHIYWARISKYLFNSKKWFYSYL